MVEHAAQSGAAVGGTVADMRRLSRIGAQQGVAHVTARDMIGDEVLVTQLGQHYVRLAAGQPGQAGRGRNGNIRPWMYPQQAEHPPGGLA